MNGGGDQAVLRWARDVLADDPRQCAEQASLIYVEDEDAFPYRRKPWGRGFTYRNARGHTVRSKTLRARFEALVIPPAWSDVCIARAARAHLQATGRDAAGRKQYLYHADWRTARDAHKFTRVVAFGRLLPTIRARVDRDLAREGLPRERVLATVVRMLETTRARVGNDEYAERNQSYGLTTVRKKHVERADEDGVVLEFTGKSGKPWRVDVEDPALVEVIIECLETPGWEIFKYYDGSEKHDVTSHDVNAYLRETCGAYVTAKDFRTWTATVLAACALRDLAHVQPEVRGNQRMLRAIERVAAELGNTPAVCRASYIHPAVLELSSADLRAVAEATHEDAAAWLRRGAPGLTPAETAVLTYLERRLRDRPKLETPWRQSA